MRPVFSLLPLSLVVAVASAIAAVRAPAEPGTPTLPDTPFEYADVPLPDHVRAAARRADNTPRENPITNEGATLGRVLFYDVRLSANETVSCGSCHRQEHGFSAPETLSPGLHGELTARHSMALANARYYAPGRFFWDERAATLEDQVLVPIQDPIEMGMDLASLESRLASTEFYPELFEAAFGSPEITRSRIARALAQFVRSMVSFGSRYDRAFEAGAPGSPGFESTFTDEELLGMRLFENGTGMSRAMGPGRRGPPRGMGPNVACSTCHGTTLQIADRVRNNGLDASGTDEGAGGGRFKAPSLRNVAVRAPFMHDGRFGTLREVVEFYNEDVRPSRRLDRALMHAAMHGLGLTATEVDAIVAFLGTLTDEAFLTDPRFSDPFAP